jgi:hypothetical protein
MQAFKVIVGGLLLLIAMDAIYVGYSQATAGDNAYVAVQDDSDEAGY